MNELFDRMRNARIYDLAQPLYAGVPHFPTHPPFLMTLAKMHGEVVLSDGGSSASETITMGGHVGTHIDALNHFSCCGKLFDNREPVQSYAAGVQPYSVEEVDPIVRRGVLIDVAGAEGVEVLPADFVVTPEHLEAAGADIRRGDVVLLRTGWARYWVNPRQFITAGSGGGVMCPGPQRPAAEWLSSKGVFAAGSDTVAFEFMPSPQMAVHVHLLAERGIHIIECLNLDQLARDKVREFLFIAAPLKIRGGTGSPIRPLAVVTAPQG